MHTFVRGIITCERIAEGWAFFAQTSQPLYVQAPKINSPAILFRRVHVVKSYGLSLAQPYTMNGRRNGFRRVTDESIS
jgi:hypothetical protein